MDEVLLARHAACHHGVFDQQTLDRLRVDPRSARRQVASGRWRQLHEGVFAAATTPVTAAVRAEAALTALPHAVLAMRTAGAVHRLLEGAAHLDDGLRDVVELSTEYQRTARCSGVIVRRTVLPTHHVTRRSGWRVTTVERTLVDLGQVLDLVLLQRTIEDALVRRRTTLARVETTFAELARRGRPGIARVRRVLEAVDPVTPTESELEAMFLRVGRRAGLPEPERQASFDWLGNGRGRVDFWYPRQRVVVELDGRRFHLRAAQFEADRTRDQLGLLHGITTVRITHHQLTSERRHVVHVLRNLLLP